MLQVEVRRRIDGPRQAVWDVYTDHVSWTDWAGVGKVRLDREGDPPPNGAGCVRVIRAGGVSAYEEIVDFEPPRRMTYRLVKGGIPIADHLGEVIFEDDGDGTRVVWRCRFRSKIPGLGFLLRAIVTRVFRRTLDGLARRRFGAAS